MEITFSYLFTYLLYYQLKYLKHSVGFCLFQLKPHSWAPLHISNTVSCILLVRGDVEQWNQTRPSKYHRGKDYFTSTKDKICVWIIIIGCLGANCHTRHFLWAGTVSGGLLHLKRSSANLSSFFPSIYEHTTNVKLMDHQHRIWAICGPLKHFHASLGASLVVWTVSIVLDSNACLSLEVACHVYVQRSTGG